MSPDYLGFYILSLDLSDLMSIVRLAGLNAIVSYAPSIAVPLKAID